MPSFQLPDPLMASSFSFLVQISSMSTSCWSMPTMDLSMAKDVTRPSKTPSWTNFPVFMMKPQRRARQEVKYRSSQSPVIFSVSNSPKSGFCSRHKISSSMHSDNNGVSISSTPSSPAANFSDDSRSSHILMIAAFTSGMLRPEVPCVMPPTVEMVMAFESWPSSTYSKSTSIFATSSRKARMSMTSPSPSDCHMSFSSSFDISPFLIISANSEISYASFNSSMLDASQRSRKSLVTSTLGREGWTLATFAGITFPAISAMLTP
mmetsp:Transcript_70316/g.178329  ORF Transcript_70316/g.178329 Transcript_70316/m.178329 type:complete len:264 (-) Transcript_70316:527-1318(-)